MVRPWLHTVSLWFGCRSLTTNECRSKLLKSELNISQLRVQKGLSDRHLTTIYPTSKSQLQPMWNSILMWTSVPSWNQEHLAECSSVCTSYITMKDNIRFCSAISDNTSSTPFKQRRFRIFARDAEWSGKMPNPAAENVTFLPQNVMVPTNDQCCALLEHITTKISISTPLIYTQGTNGTGTLCTPGWSTVSPVIT